MRVTEPISTPRYLSLLPMSRPCTDSLKYVSTVSFGVNQRPLPMMSRMTTSASTAPMTNRPSL